MMYLSILLCAIVSMIIGAIWYGPLFGDMWLRIIGADAQDMKAREEMRKAAGPLYAIQFILSLAQFGILTFFIQEASLMASVQISGLFWLGFIMPTLAGTAMWNNNSREIQRAQFFIQSGYQLVIMLVAGMIIQTLA